jgi:DNA-binding IclR family transcriptional regulator
MIPDDHLAETLRALAHPARLAILRALAERGTCVCGEIVGTLPLAQSTVSQHLKILKDAGLIRGTMSGPRSCYCLDAGALDAASAAMSALFAGLVASRCGSDAQASALATPAIAP